MEEQTKFPIVGIGASAGGLKAFISFLRELEMGTGYAYVIIQHLMPDHKSLLPELLSKVTSIPVNFAEHDLIIAPENIYVIPPGKYLSVKDGKLILSKPDSQHRMPIDYFFRSLASEYHEKAIAVVLSGTADDGTLGLKEIKASGGLTFVQDDASAEFKGMPQNAVKDLDVDFILPPGEIAKEIFQISRKNYLNKHSYTGVNGTDTESGRNEILEKIFRLLWNRTGVDFVFYKPNTINRRIERRMLLHKIEDITAYYDYLKDNSSEVDMLYKDLLINVTNFFRDPDTFEVLKKKIYPVFKENISEDSSIRIWIPACSTGEEVYSIAITLLEYFGDTTSRSFQLFASDLSREAVDKARSGIYPESIVQDVSPKRLKKYFTKIDDKYQVNRNIRDLVLFAYQDLAKDPPFSRVDMISCRNLLIYLSSGLQKKIIPMFHFALNPNGYLLLGNNESIGTYPELFSIIEKNHKIYTKKPNRVKANYDFYEKSARRETAASESDIQAEIEKIFLSRYPVSGVVVDNSMDILFFKGDTSDYLNPSQGSASLNLSKMVRQEILLDVSTLFHKVKKTRSPAARKNLRISNNGSKRKIDIEIFPVFLAEGNKKEYYLIIFEDSHLIRNAGAPEREVIENKSTDDESVHQELRTTKEYLQSIIDEKELSNEELRSTLEELQSTNEEMQSINEEVETSKEELQCANEELAIVNDELQSRNSELILLNDDLGNVLSSVSIPILLLDRELKIRRYTPAAEKIFSLMSTDIGRPVTDLRSGIRIEKLKEVIDKVLVSAILSEAEIQDETGKWYSLRVRPYRRSDDKINGVILTLIDIDIIRKSLEEMDKARELANNIVDTVREPLVILDEQLNITTANKSFYELFQLLPDETEGKCIFDVNDYVFNLPEFRHILQNLLPKHKTLESLKIKADFPQIGEKKLILNARKIIQHEKSSPLILLAMEEEK